MTVERREENMDALNEWVGMGKELSSLIRPRSFPLAIKLIKHGENFPEKGRHA